MASNRIQDALVVFSPSGKRGRFAIGTPVLQAARSLGVDIDSVCGGRAMCGHCQVTVTEGELSKHGIVSALVNLSPPAETERRFTEENGLDASHRLSCRARIEGDLAVDVPASSQVHRQVIRKPGEAHDIEIDPVVHPYFIEVAPPDLRQPDSDVQRVFDALYEQWHLEGLHCDLPAQQRLQGVLRKGSWQITVAVRNDEQIIAAWPGLRDRLYGVAVDVGSTTVAAHLCDLRNGELLKSAGAMNPQIRFGEDLMSRVSYIMANPDSESELTAEIRRAVSNLVGELCDAAAIDSDEIVEMTFVGNPIRIFGKSPGTPQRFFTYFCTAPDHQSDRHGEAACRGQGNGNRFKPKGIGLN